MKEAIGWIALYLVGFPAVIFGGAVLLYVLSDHFGLAFWVLLGLSVASYIGYLYGKSGQRS